MCSHATDIVVHVMSSFLSVLLWTTRKNVGTERVTACRRLNQPPRLTQPSIAIGYGKLSTAGVKAGRVHLCVIPHGRRRSVKFSAAKKGVHTVQLNPYVRQTCCLDVNCDFGKTHKPVTHVIIFAAPAVIVVGKSVDAFEVRSSESSNAAKYVLIRNSAVAKINSSVHSPSTSYSSNSNSNLKLARK